MSPSWVQVYEARFGKKLSEEEVAVWENEIQTDIRGLKPGELVESIRALAEDDRKGGGTKRKFAPDCETIISAIIRRRYRTKAAEQAAAACELCNDGWVSFGFIYDREGPISLGGMKGYIGRSQSTFSMPMATVCKCDRGSRALAKAIEAKRTTHELARQLQDAVWAELFPMAWTKQ